MVSEATKERVSTVLRALCRVDVARHFAVTKSAQKIETKQGDTINLTVRDRREGAR